MNSRAFRWTVLTLGSLLAVLYLSRPVKLGVESLPVRPSLNVAPEFSAGVADSVSVADSVVEVDFRNRIRELASQEFGQALDLTAYQELCRVILEADLLEAILLGERVLDPVRAFIFRSLLLARLSNGDPARVVGAADTLLAEKRMDALSQAICIMASKTPSLAAGWLSVKWKQLDPLILRQSFGALGDSGPEFALKGLAPISDPEGRHAAIGGLAEGWAGRDMEQAVSWILSIEGDLQTAALSAALPRLAEQNWRYAADLVATMTNATNLSDWQAVVAEAGARQDPEGTAQWLETIPSNANRRMATEKLVEVWAQTSPQDALHYAEAQPDSSLREGLLLSAIQVGILVDQEHARDWVAALPPGTFRERAHEVLAATLSTTTPEAAAEWAGQLAPTDRTDLVAATIASGLFFENPQSASAWLSMISDSELRRQTITALFANSPKSAEILKTWYDDEGNLMNHHLTPTNR